MPLRVIQWTTGNVAKEAVRAVAARPDLELVGAFAYSPAKVGVDLGELCGLGSELGVLATDDVDSLLALDPDCAVYSPLRFDVNEVALLLRAGINVVTSAEFVTGSNLSPSDRASLEAAAAAGGASLFGSGMNPGFAQLAAAVAGGLSTSVSHVSMTESVDVSQFVGDANFAGVGWGRPKGDPNHTRSRGREPEMGGDHRLGTGMDRRTRLPSRRRRRSRRACAYRPHPDSSRPGRSHPGTDAGDRTPHHRRAARQRHTGGVRGPAWHCHLCRPTYSGTAAHSTSPVMRCRHGRTVATTPRWSEPGRSTASNPVGTGPPRVSTRSRASIGGNARFAG